MIGVGVRTCREGKGGGDIHSKAACSTTITPLVMAGRTAHAKTTQPKQEAAYEGQVYDDGW